MLRNYYNLNTLRSTNGRVIRFRATGRILDGRHATYTRKGPVVAFYSSRGPDVNNNLRENADVLKPNIMAPGTAIWGAWSPDSQSMPESIGTYLARVYLNFSTYLNLEWMSCIVPDIDRIMIYHIVRLWYYA